MSAIKYLTVNGARLGYQVHAEGSGRPPAIFVHGYSGRSTGDAYPQLLEALSDTFTVYALDVRGHGASAAEVDDWSIAALADDVAAFARALGIVGAVFIGHSMGGFNGMYCEVRHPGTFSALCLLATAAASGGAHAGPHAGRFLIEHGQNPEILMAGLSTMYIHGGDASANVAAILLMDRRVHETYFVEYVTLSIAEEIGRIRIPVLVLNGALDNVVPPAAQHDTAMSLPFCKEVTYSTEGHMLPLESGALAAREIVAFWTHDMPLMGSRGT